VQCGAGLVDEVGGQGGAEVQAVQGQSPHVQHVRRRQGLGDTDTHTQRGDGLCEAPETTEWGVKKGGVSLWD
jgi:hypothetical protein